MAEPNKKLTIGKSEKDFDTKNNQKYVHYFVSKKKILYLHRLNGE